MRYHWGLGVGHFHAHQNASSCIPQRSKIDVPDDSDLGQPSGGETTTSFQDNNTHDEQDDPELDLEDRELEGWDDVESDDDDDGRSGGNDSEQGSENGDD